MYNTSKNAETPSLLFTGDIAPDSRIYPTKTLLFVEGARTPGEKTFPLHSPNVQKVEVVRKGRVRRAKLYYLRDRLGKSAKIKEKI